MNHWTNPNSSVISQSHILNYMGHTVRSQRQIIDELRSELESYGEVLTKKERKELQKILKKPYKYVGSITNASSLHAWAFLTISICLEQQKELTKIKEELESYQVKEV